MTILMTLTATHELMDSLSDKLDAQIANIEHRRFPDGETYLRVLTDVQQQDVVLVNDLHNPNGKIIDLILLSNTVKSLGAKSVGLVAPYLAYMRQDMVFNPGEGITSHYFAELMSQHFDWLITVDPHLHRIDSLDDIYSIPATTLHASQPIADWLNKNVRKPLLIGPDSESEQWVKAIGQLANVPFEVLTKVRHGDRHVEVSVPHTEEYRDHTPVLVDDIISTGRTMLETAEHLKNAGLNKPICVGVHAVFAPGAAEDMANGYVEKVVTCNSISDETNGILLDQLLVDGINEKLQN